MHDDPTPRLVFPDTTVLINFALVDEMPLLGQLVANNGSWCGTVASECDDQASKQGLPHMRDAHDIFSEPLRLETPAEFVNFRLNQDFFRQASTNPDATHAGESETLAILTSRSIKSVVAGDELPDEVEIGLGLPLLRSFPSYCTRKKSAVRGKEAQ